MTTNWQTNIGGALGALGSALVGVGVVPQLAGTPNKFLTVVAIAGFFCSAAGKFFTALFAADAKTVAAAQTQIAELQLRSNIVPNAIDSGDTSALRRAPITPSTTPVVAPPDVVAVATPPNPPVVPAGQPTPRV